MNFWELITLAFIIGVGGSALILLVYILWVGFWQKYDRRVDQRRKTIRRRDHDAAITTKQFYTPFAMRDFK